jgi:hypothetical protein
MDFKKAFDSVPHKAFSQKLNTMVSKRKSSTGYQNLVMT